MLISLGIGNTFYNNLLQLKSVVDFDKFHQYFLYKCRILPLSNNQKEEFSDKFHRY